MAFNEAPAQLNEIRDALRDLALEDWRTLDPQLQADTEGQVNMVIAVLNGMLQATSADPNIHGRKPELESQLPVAREFFRTRVKPRAVKAQIRRELDERLREGDPATAESTAALRATIEDLRQELAEIAASRDKLNRELDAQRALVEATRDVTSAEGAEALGGDYDDQAKEHDKACWQWGIALAVAIVVAALAGYLVIDANRPPEDASTARVVSSIALDLLVVGVLVYVVRVTSHQFSVHRHLAAVARNKASALSTFNRIVSAGTEADTERRWPSL